MEDKRNSVKLKWNKVNETHAEGGGDSKRGKTKKTGSHPRTSV